MKKVDTKRFLECFFIKIGMTRSESEDFRKNIISNFVKNIGEKSNPMDILYDGDGEDENFMNYLLDSGFVNPQYWLSTKELKQFVRDYLNGSFYIPNGSKINVIEK